MRDEFTVITYTAQIEAIKAEIEAAKLDNAIRMHQSPDDYRLNYPYEWFLQKAQELNDIAVNIWKYA